MANPSTEKSQAASVILTLCFGPFGLLYASLKEALFFILVGLPVLVIYSVATTENVIEFGFKMLTYGSILYLASIVRGVVLVNKHNREVAEYRDRIANNRHVEQLEAIEQANKPTSTAEAVPQSDPKYY